MIDLSKKKILDKLYSYREDNSPILLDIDTERNEYVIKRDNTLININDLENLLESLKKKENLLNKKGEVLLKNISNFMSDDDLTVISMLNLDFDPESIKKQIENKLPDVINEVKDEISVNNTKLDDEEAILDETLIKIEELGIKHDEAVSNQLRLNRYLDLALSGDVNYTRDEIMSLLSNFNLQENEIHEAAKMLMFPEDDLYDYDNNSKPTPVVNEKVSEVITKEEKKEPEVNNVIIEPETSEDIIIPSKEELPLEVKETETKEETTKEYLIEYLKSNEIDYLDFTNNDFEKLLDNFNRELFNKNIAIITELNFDKDILSDNVSLFYDQDLQAKINILTENGKKAEDINYNPSILTKYTLDELKNAINVLKENGLDPKNVPLMAY